MNDQTSEAQPYTVRRIMALAGMTKAQIQGCIRRGDLHAERFGGFALVIEPAEAEAFVRYVEAIRAAAPPPERRRGSYCLTAPGGRCPCGCHLKTAGRSSRPLRSGGWTTWQPAHDTVLRELVAEGLPPEVIAERLSARCSAPRTVHSVRLRIRKLGLSTRDGWLSGEDLIRTLGIVRRRVQQFEAQGLLTATDYGRWRRYPLAQIEALVKSQAGVTIDPRRVRDPRLKAIAEMAATVNRRRQASA